MSMSVIGERLNIRGTDCKRLNCRGFIDSLGTLIRIMTNHDARPALHSDGSNGRVSQTSRIEIEVWGGTAR